MKTHQAQPAHKEFNDAMIEVMRGFQDRLSGLEMLAIASHFVGALIAAQDQRSITPAQAMQLVAKNIEMGNLRAMETLGDTKGAG